MENIVDTLTNFSDTEWTTNPMDSSRDIENIITHTDNETTTIFESYSTIASLYENDDEYKELKEFSERLVGIFDIFLIPLVLFGNLLVLISIAKYRSLRTSANIFIASLSCADLMLGFCTLPLYSLLYLDRKMNDLKYPCIMKFVFVLITMCASLLSLLAIAYDRFIAITKPLKYAVIMTRGKARKIVIFLWVYTLLVCTVPLFWNYYDPHIPNPCNFYVIFPPLYTAFVSYISIFVALSFAMGFYIKIFIVAKNHRMKNLLRKAKMGGKSVKQFEKDSKSAKTMFIILFLFFAFWLPLQAIGPLGYLNIKPNLLETLKNCTLGFAMLNSFVNPIIYSWARKDFRIAFKKIFGISLKKELNGTSPQVSSNVLLYTNGKNTATNRRSFTSSGMERELDKIQPISDGKLDLETNSRFEYSEEQETF